jgi:hypothetical protein
MRKSGLLAAVLVLAACSGKSKSGGASPGDGNGDPAHATALSIGTTASGTVSDAGDVDFFSFTVTGGVQSVRFWTTDGTGSGCAGGVDTVLEVRDGAGQVLGSNDDSGSELCSAVTVTVAPGTYYVAVGAASGTPFAYRLFSSPVTGGIAEPNDDFATASPVMAGTVLQGTLTPTDYQDYLTFTVDGAAKRVVITLYDAGGQTCDGRASTGLYDTSQQSVVWSSSAGAGCVRYDLILAPGSYYLGVFSQGEAVSYSLFIQELPLAAELEPDDVISTASPLSPGTPVVASIGSASDVDVYVFTVPANGTLVQLETSDGTGNDCVGIDTNLQLLDGAGALIVNQDQGGIGNCSKVVRVVPAGTYYAVVTGFAPASFPYMLRLDLTASVPLSLAQPVAATNRSSRDLQAWAVQVPGPGASLLRARTYDPTSGYCFAVTSDVWVFDDAGGLVTQGSGDCQDLTAAVSSGTYYVAVGSNWDYPGPYTLAVTTGSAASEIEPNDSAATATPTAAGALVMGRISAASDVDHYALTVGADGSVLRATTFDTSFGNCAADVQTTLELRDGGGALLASGGSWGTGHCSDVVRIVSAGAYDVVVGPYGTATSFAYGLVTDVEVPTSVALGTDAVGVLTTTAQQDWYAFTVPAGGAALTLTMVDGSGSGCQGAPSLLGLFDRQGTSISTDWVDGALCEDPKVLPAGDYLLAVSGESIWSAFPYSVHLGSVAVTAIEVEPNDVPASANGPVTQSALIAGTLPYGDVDYFAVQNPAASPVTVHLETFSAGPGTCNSNTDTLLQVQAANGTVLASDDDSGVRPCSALDYTIPAGTTVYVAVSGYWDVPMYELQVSFP